MKDPRDIIDMTNVKLPQFKLKSIVPLLLLAVAALTAWSAFYNIEPEEKGIILRFGKYVAPPTEPGLHVKAPFGIDKLIKVPVQRQLKEEFGFRTTRAGVKTQYSSGSFEDESLMLTGDLNAAVVEWTVQYRPTDPVLYLFRVRNVTDTFRYMSEATMREIVGDRTVSEVLTVGREEIASEAERKLQELCDQYEMGITVVQVVLQDVNPPDFVKPSFNEVNQAEQEKEKLINQSRAEYNKVIPKARGEAQQTIQQAEGYALDRVNRATGEAARFEALLAAYHEAPEVTRRRLYLETMGDVMPRAGRKIVIDEDAKGFIPLLDLRGKEVSP